MFLCSCFSKSESKSETSGPLSPQAGSVPLAQLAGNGTRNAHSPKELASRPQTEPNAQALGGNQPAIRTPISTLLNSAPVEEKEDPSADCTPAPCEMLIWVNDPGPSDPKTLSELDQVIAEFRKNYQQFAKKNRYLSIKDGVEKAIEQAGSEKNVKLSAQIFETHIDATLKSVENKQNDAKAKWTGKVGGFMKKLYPVARISLQLTSSAAEVLCLRRFNPDYECHPLKVGSRWFGCYLTGRSLIATLMVVSRRWDWPGGWFSSSIKKNWVSGGKSRSKPTRRLEFTHHSRSYEREINRFDDLNRKVFQFRAPLL